MRPLNSHFSFARFRCCGFDHKSESRVIDNAWFRLHVSLCGTSAFSGKWLTGLRCVSSQSWTARFSPPPPCSINTPSVKHELLRGRFLIWVRSDELAACIKTLPTLRSINMIWEWSRTCGSPWWLCVSICVCVCVAEMYVATRQNLFLSFSITEGADEQKGAETKFCGQLSSFLAPSCLKPAVMWTAGALWD